MKAPPLDGMHGVLFRSRVSRCGAGRDRQTLALSIVASSSPDTGASMYENAFNRIERELRNEASDLPRHAGADHPASSKASRAAVPHPGSFFSG